jgi:uncharacterized protein YbaR (Trm112 family)
VFIPLVDVLRCPNTHDETWLVASIDRADNRDILAGTLGCPICMAEYPIRDGVVVFDEAATHPPYYAPSEGDAVRLAAALDLTDARMTAVLQGAWGGQAPIIAAMSPVRLLLINPPDGIASGDGVSIVRAAAAPLARGSANAAAFDASASPAMIASLVASVRPGARLIGPASSAVPAGATELARDDEIWVAHVEGATTSAPVSLARRRRE